MVDQNPEPQARPVFRWLAAMLALLMLMAAIWDLIEQQDDNRLRGYLLFAAALWFGAMASTGRLYRSNEKTSISARHPEPQARPIFRWLAAVLAVMMFFGAVYWLQTDGRFAGLLLFGGALWFGGMALTGRSNRGGQ